MAFVAPYLNGVALTRYLTPGVNSQRTDELQPIVMPVACTADNLRALVIQTSGGTATSIAFTIRVNGSNSSVTCTSATADNSSCADTSNSVAIAAGDRVLIQAAGSGTTPLFTVGFRCR